ncbi:aminopeptidase N [Orussus abietinus]|uniref:aminopeptidase N n=1 Tax=Orussus abietinus TaxID=222816 RepID=UPI0006256CD2|nr:aminopeptidase N [Orussus abietinus]
MRRGSVTSWQPWARRNSATMAQIAGGRSEFTASDLNDEGPRKQGCLLTAKTGALIVFLFVLGMLLAGYLGAYVSSLPGRETRDAAGGEDAVEEEKPPRFSISPGVEPSRYVVELTPLVENFRVTGLEGRVTVEFRYNGPGALDKVVLNAINLTATKYALLDLNPVEPENTTRPRRRRREADSTSEATPGTMETSAGSETPENGPAQSATTSPEIVDASSSELATPSNGDITETPLSNNSSLSTTLPESSNSSGPFHPTTSRDDRELGATGRPVGLIRHETDAASETLVLYPERPLGPGSYALEIRYEAPVLGRGVFYGEFALGGSPRWTLVSRLKPIGARRAFPLFDDQRLRANFSLSVTRDRGSTVLSNMPVKSTRASSDDRVTDTFEDAPRLPPHGLAFLRTDLELLETSSLGASRGAIRAWAFPETKRNASYLFEKAKLAVRGYEELFSVDYPLPKLDLVGLHRSPVADIGAPGLIGIEESLFYANERSPATTRERALKDLARLVGEQWLGGLVGAQNWTDAWILEGSLASVQRMVLEKMDPAIDGSSSFVANVQSDRMDEDAFAASRPLRAKVHPEDVEIFPAEYVYGKGACVSRMLHGLVGDVAFRSGIGTFVSRWSFASADVDGFLEAMGAAARARLPAGWDLKDVLSPWITESGYPVVTVLRNYETGSATVRQARFTYDETASPGRFWNVPLTHVADGDDWRSPATTWLNDSAEVKLDNVGSPEGRSWVVFNVDRIGYYRVNYDDKNWQLLTEALYNDHESIPPATRTALVDDVFGLARAGSTSYEVAFRLAKYLQIKERHHAPWLVAMKHVRKIANVLYDSSFYPDFQNFLLEFISPLYNEVGHDVDSGSQLALVATQWACMVEEPRCIEWARKTFVRVKSSENEEVPVHVRETVYRVVAKYGAREEWRYLRQKATAADQDKEERDRVLSSLACFQVPRFLQTILYEIIGGKTFTEGDVSIILESFPKNPVASQMALKFVRTRWDEIASRFSRSRAILRSFLVALSSGLTTPGDLQDFQSFKERNRESLETVWLAAARVESEASSWISWLNESLPSVRTWVENGNDSAL